MRRTLLRRTVWAVLIVYLFLSGIFFGMALTDDPTSPMFGGEDYSQRYGEIRDESEPLLSRYVEFLGWYTTLDLGRSVLFDESVSSILARSLPLTLLYLVPAIALASLGSLSVGIFTALRSGGVVDRVTSACSRLGIALPAVAVADLVAFGVGQAAWYPAFSAARGLLAPANLALLVLPMLVAAFNLWAAQAVAVRSEAAAYVPREFVRTFRASGARDRDVARHVLRNAAPSLLALFVSEVLLTLLVTMYVVEVAFGLPGFGFYSYYAFFKPDLALVVPAVVVPVIVGVVANTAQDLVAVRLDPRADG